MKDKYYCNYELGIFYNKELKDLDSMREECNNYCCKCCHFLRKNNEK